MKLVKYFFAFSFIGLIFFGCDSFHLEKRRYMKGYYFSSSTSDLHKKNDKKEEAVISSIDKKEDLLPVTDGVPVADQKHLMANADKKRSQKAKVSLLSSDQTPAVVPAYNSFKDDSSQRNFYSQTSFLKEGKNTNDRDAKGAYLLTALAAFFSLSVFGFLKYKHTTSLNASRWALKNRVRTRILLTVAQLMVGVGGHFIGSQLFDLNFTFSDLARNVIIGGFLTGLLFYPRQKKHNFGFIKAKYLRQKAFDFILIFTGSLLAICSGNKAAYVSHMSASNHAVYSHSSQNLSSLIRHNDETEPLSKKKKAEDNLRIFLTILSIILLVAIEVVIVFLSCYLMCSNQVGLAALLLIGGTALLVVASVFLFKWLNKLGRDPVVEKTN